MSINTAKVLRELSVAWPLAIPSQPLPSERSLIVEGDLAMRASDFNLAAEYYEKALSSDPSLLFVARRNLSIALLKAGKIEMAWRYWREELATGEDAIHWAQSEIEHAMGQGDFALLGDLGRLLAQYQWSSRWYPTRDDPPVMRVPRDILTVAKLRHDAEQFRYLRQLNLLSNEFDSTIIAYENIADRLINSGENEARIKLKGEDRAKIGDTYNRIVYMSDISRVKQALSPGWSLSPEEVEKTFLENAPGVVVIDNFLTAEALKGIRRFVMESTIWSGIRYFHGRLGAFFNDGFNCPLLLQVAEELMGLLPHVIGRNYPLRQMWAFKNSTDLPPDVNIHADFSAVNVNFWITPDECNLDSRTGGMIVYDVDAPQAWDFHTYNGSADIIKAFLRENHAQEIYIPYRQNRCIIFNSDLFHGTHEVRFKPGLENHRVNVTMLYGHREDDNHHRSLTSRPDLKSRWSMQYSPWRSLAFTRFRV